MLSIPFDSKTPICRVVAVNHTNEALCQNPSIYSAVLYRVNKHKTMQVLCRVSEDTSAESHHMHNDMQKSLKRFHLLCCRLLYNCTKCRMKKSFLYKSCTTQFGSVIFPSLHAGDNVYHVELNNIVSNIHSNDTTNILWPSSSANGGTIKVDLGTLRQRLNDGEMLLWLALLKYMGVTKTAMSVYFYGMSLMQKNFKGVQEKYSITWRVCRGGQEKIYNVLIMHINRSFSRCTVFWF